MSDRYQPMSNAEGVEAIRGAMGRLLAYLVDAPSDVLSDVTDIAGALGDGGRLLVQQFKSLSGDEGAAQLLQRHGIDGIREATAGRTEEEIAAWVRSELGRVSDARLANTVTALRRFEDDPVMGGNPAFGTAESLRESLSVGADETVERVQRTARNFTEFLRGDRQRTERIINERQALRARVAAQLQSQFGSDLGQQVDAQGRPVAQEGTALDRARAGQQFLGLPQGYIPEFQMDRERAGGLTNPDALASWASNQTQRQIATDQQGQPLGEDGLPLINPQTGEPRPGVEPLYASEGVIGPDLYDEIDSFQVATSMTPQQRRRLQARLVRAGVAPEGAQITGAWTTGWAEALGTVMGYANINGVRWNDALNEVQAQQELGIESTISELRRAFDSEQAGFRPPDQQTLRNAVVESVRSAVRRAPTTEEMATLLGDMSASYRAAYDADRRAAEAQFAQSIQSPLESIPDDLRTDDDRAAIDAFGQQVSAEFGDPSAEIAQVDPQAQFTAKFNEMFQGRMDRADERVGHMEAQGAMSARAGSLLSRLGGRV